MNQTELITATGTGTWYLSYEVSLATVTRQFRSKYSADEKTTVHYELRFKQTDASNWDSRQFESEAKRNEFIERSFSEISLTQVEEPIATPINHPVSAILQQRLTSITFILDYVQIIFDDYTFTAYVWPEVRINGTRFCYNDAGYRDALCSLIEKTVSQFEEFLDVGIVLDFHDGISLEIHTAEEGYNWPEAVLFHGPDNLVMIW